MGKLDAGTSEFEQVLQKIAVAIATGAFSEKLPPSKLLEKTENCIDLLYELAKSNQESMLLLKPEKTLTIKAKHAKLAQTLTTFKDILLQNTSDPLANSRLAFEQLRKALNDGSEFLFLMREVRDNPSPLISNVLTFKERPETRMAASMNTSENTQALAKHVLDHVEILNTELEELEKRITDIKQTLQRIREASPKALSSQAEGHRIQKDKTERRQPSLSHFKAEHN